MENISMEVDSSRGRLSVSFTNTCILKKELENGVLKDECFIWFSHNLDLKKEKSCRKINGYMLDNIIKKNKDDNIKVEVGIIPIPLPKNEDSGEHYYKSPYWERCNLTLCVQKDDDEVLGSLFALDPRLVGKDIYPHAKTRIYSVDIFLDDMQLTVIRRDESVQFNLSGSEDKINEIVKDLHQKLGADGFDFDTLILTENNRDSKAKDKMNWCRISLWSEDELVIALFHNEKKYVLYLKNFFYYRAYMTVYVGIGEPELPGDDTLLCRSMYTYIPSWDEQDSFTRLLLDFFNDPEKIPEDKMIEWY